MPEGPDVALGLYDASSGQTTTNVFTFSADGGDSGSDIDGTFVHVNNVQLVFLLYLHNSEAFIYSFLRASRLILCFYFPLRAHRPSSIERVYDSPRLSEEQFL